MFTMLKKTGVILIVLAALPWFLSGLRGTAVAAESCITGQCHPKMLKSKNIHPVAEPCDTCHQAAVTPHPQKGKKTFKLTQEVPGLCSQCHPPLGKAKHVHPPVKDGMCTTCHNPHDSGEPKLLQQPIKDLCLSCHPDKADYKYVHGPTATGDCTSCHNPHESKNKALVLKEGTELCFTCHVDMQGELKKKVIHPAIQSGCTSCHNPHGSPAKKLLAAEGEKVCYQCHPQIEEQLQKSKFVHPPIKSEKGCASCHAPHASDEPKLLPKTGKDLCLDCHKGIIQKEQTVLHGPIRDGKCTPCHNPHGSQYNKLLVKEFSTDIYIVYNDNEYALCFTCHNRDLLRYPKTSYATGFRDGDKNLHYVHVNKKDRGKNCKLCHLIHAGELPKLMATKVPFGKWNLPLRSIKTDTGGSCSPGCHKKYNYDRKTPGKEPEIIKPKEKEPEKAKEKDKEKDKAKSK